MKTVIIHLKGNSGSLRFNATDAGMRDGNPFFLLPEDANFSIPVLATDSIAAMIVSDATDDTLTVSAE